MNSFYEHHKDSINWHYRSFDRILLNELIQPFQQPERVVGFFSTYRPVAPRPDRSFTPTYPTTLGRKPIAATVTIQPQRARTRGEIPIAPAAPPPHTYRDFVPWRFLDAGRHSAWKGSSCRRPKACTTTDSCSAANCILIRSLHRRARAGARAHRGRAPWRS
jgi:hypothetical protein